MGHQLGVGNGQAGDGQAGEARKAVSSVNDHVVGLGRQCPQGLTFTRPVQPEVGGQQLPPSDGRLEQPPE